MLKNNARNSRLCTYSCNHFAALVSHYLFFRGSYIRLTYLIPPLLDMVDENKIALRPAVELSYLSETEQAALQEAISSEDCTPSHAQAIKMRGFSENGKLSPDVILSIMQEEKPNQVEQFKIPRSRIDKFFPAGTPAQKIEDIIVKALEMYRKRQREMER